MPESTTSEWSELTKDYFIALLKKCRKNEPIDEPIKRLILYQEQVGTGKNDREIVAHIFRDSLQGLKTTKSSDKERVSACLIEEYFLNKLHGSGTVSLLKKLGVTTIPVDNVFNLVSIAADHLCRAVLHREQWAREERIEALEARIEASENKIGEFVGLQAHIDRLQVILNDLKNRWIILIYGEAGIGKTTFVSQLLKHVAREDCSWPDLLWVTAPSRRVSAAATLYPVLAPEDLVGRLLTLATKKAPNIGEISLDDARQRLRLLFRKRKHVVVIDNLQTAADVKAILPVVRSICAPTKFILIAREPLYEASDMYHYKVPPLNDVLSLQLLRDQVNFHGLIAGDSDLQIICGHAKGTPKVLLTIMGQVREHGIDSVLSNLKNRDSER